LIQQETRGHRPIVQMLGLGVRSYAGINLVLVGIWIAVAFGLYRENRRLTSERAATAVA
jgi:hypothetical protein